MNDVVKQLEPRLEGLGKPLIYAASLGSTNTALKQMAAKGQAHGTCLLTDYQTNGRGRMDRHWQARAGSSLLFSLLLRPQADIARMFVFTALAGLAICNALDEYGVNAQIKWPNDVFVQGLKLCGMLSEINKDGSLVIGIGVNVNQETGDMAGLPGISLKMATNKQWSRQDLLVFILNNFTACYCQWQQAPCAWHAAYIERSWLLGKSVVVREGENILNGYALTVAMDGALLLELDDGRRHKLSHGDVSVLAIDGKYK